MPVIVGRLDHRGQPIADLELVGAHHRVTVLIDTGYDGEVFLYHEPLRQAGLEITFGARTLEGFNQRLGGSGGVRRRSPQR